MGNNEWRRVEEIFHRIAEAAVEDRARLLDELTDDRPELRDQVERLLAADAEAGSFLDRPAARIPTDAPAPTWEGRQLGAYRIEELIGRGGMGQVYLARRADGAFDQRVAIKLIQGLGGPAVLERFRRERQILARLEHPNIARLIDGGTSDEGVPYLVMEYVEGEPLDRYADREHLPIEERLRLFLAVAAAVSSAHRNLVVHRDLKPSNILVGEDGGPKLLDFGIAKLLDPAEGDLTVASERALTPRYASPEQCEGRPVTTASDVYSLGVLLYELLAGALPRSEARGGDRETVTPSRSLDTGSDAAGSPLDRAAAIAERRGVALDALRRRLRGDLDAICLKALERDPERRYPTVEELAEDLRRHLDGQPVRARAGGFGYRFGKLLRRHRWAAAAVAVLLASILGFAGAMALQSNRLARERDEAERQRSNAEAAAQFLVDVFRLTDPARTAHDTPAAEIVTRAAEVLEGRFDDQPEVRDRLRHALGEIHYNLGLYEGGYPLLEQAAAALEASPGADPELQSGVLYLLGSTELRRGDREAARQAFEAGLASQRRAGRWGETAAILLSQVGDLDRLDGRYDDSVAVLEEAASLLEGLGREESMAYGNCLANLGATLAEMDRFDESIERQQRAIEVMEALGPEAETYLVGVRHNLGYVFMRQGRAAEVVPLLEEVIAFRRQRLGEGNPRVLNSRQGLVLARMALGQWREVEAEQRAILDALARSVGPDHRLSIRGRLFLGVILHRLGSLDEAETLLAGTSNQARGMLAPGDFKLANWLLAHARLWVDTGRCGDAEPLLREAEALRREHLGRGARPDELAEVLVERALCAARRDAVEEGRALAREAAKGLAEGTIGWSTGWARERLETLGGAAALESSRD